MTIADDRLTVRLSRDLWQLERRHLDLAQAISAIAAKPDAVDTDFWCACRSSPRPSPELIHGDHLPVRLARRTPLRPSPRRPPSCGATCSSGWESALGTPWRR
jgi:hypothetical protein